jgi:hypothetical protein
MENQMMIGVWIITVLITFIPMPLMYKIIGIVVSIALIAAYIVIARRNSRLSTMSLVISLLVIGWDLAVVYIALSNR